MYMYFVEKNVQYMYVFYRTLQRNNFFIPCKPSTPTNNNN